MEPPKQDQAAQQGMVRAHHSVMSEYDPGRIWQILPGHNPNMTLSITIQRFCLFGEMEPPRQDQAIQQDKVRAPPFGIIRIWPW